MNCDDVKRVLYDFVDGELSGEAKKLMTEHINLCENCRHAVQFEAQFKARVAESLSSQTLPAALKLKLKQQLLAEGAKNPGVFSRVFANPALSFALAACLSLLVALSVFRPSEPAFTLSQIMESLHLPQDVHTHFLACKNCQEEVLRLVLAHENGQAHSHPRAMNFKDAIRHLQKCTPCREHTIQLIRAHMHEET